MFTCNHRLDVHTLDVRKRYFSFPRSENEVRRSVELSSERVELRYCVRNALRIPRKVGSGSVLSLDLLVPSAYPAMCGRDSSVKLKKIIKFPIPISYPIPTFI